MVRHHLYVSAWVCAYVCVYVCVWPSESILTVHPLNLRHTLLQTCSFHILRLFYYDRTHRHLWHNKTERLKIKHDEFLGDEDNCCQRAGLANSSLQPATLPKLWYWWHTGAKFKSRVPKPPNRNPRVTHSQVHKADQSDNFYIFKPKTPLLQDLNRGLRGVTAPAGSNLLFHFWGAWPEGPTQPLRNSRWIPPWPCHTDVF